MSTQEQIHSHSRRRAIEAIFGSLTIFGGIAAFAQIFPKQWTEFEDYLTRTVPIDANRVTAWALGHPMWSTASTLLVAAVLLAVGFRRRFEEQVRMRIARSQVRVVSWRGFQRPSLTRTPMRLGLRFRRRPTLTNSGRWFGRSVHIVEYTKEIANIDTLRLNGYPIYVAVIDHEAIPDLLGRLVVLNNESPSKIELGNDQIKMKSGSVPIMDGIGHFLAENRLVRDIHGGLLGIPVRWGCNEILVRKGSHINPESWAELDIDTLIGQLRGREQIGLLDWYYPVLLSFVAAELAHAKYPQLEFPLRGEDIAAWMSNVHGKSCSKVDANKFLIERGVAITTKIADAIVANKIDFSADFTRLSHKLSLPDYAKVPIVIGAGSMVECGSEYQPLIPLEGVFSWIECLCLLADRETTSDANAKRRAASFADYADLLLSRRGQQVLSGFGRDGRGPYGSIPITKEALNDKKVRLALEKRFGDLVQHNAVGDLHRLSVKLWPRRIIDDRIANYEIKRRWEQAWVENVQSAFANR